MRQLDRRFFLIPFSRGTAKFNMERDIELFNGFFKELSGLRTYGWVEKCITYGRIQNPPQTPLPFARRPTGGGIVVHSSDISFSFFINPNSPLWQTSLHSTYMEIAEVIKASLIKKGFPVHYPAEVRQDNKRREMCFERAERYELVMDGRKIMGCALFKKGKRFLAQGTILLEIPPSEFENSLSEVLKEKGLEVYWKI